MKASLLNTVLPSLVVTVMQASAQSPESPDGRTIELAISSGNGPFAESGAYRFQPSVINDRYAIIPLSGFTEPGGGSYSYQKTGVDTAAFSLVDDDVGGLNVELAFTSPIAGTYLLTSTEVQGASQTGTFEMFSGQSVESIAGYEVTIVISSGADPFGSFGSYRFLPANIGSTYTIEAVSGETVNSSGTFAYTRTSLSTGLIELNDAMAGSGIAVQLSYDSSSTGMVFIQQSGSAGFQAGTFTALVIPPEIVVHPENQILERGETAEFSVTATGTQPLSYQWRKFSSNIPGANESTYSIGNIQPSDSGDYDVVVSNSAGSDTSFTIALFVVYPPEITQQPSNASVEVGGDASFEVVADGFPPPTYQWSREGEAIADATNSTFTINGVGFSDSGHYSVQVSNALQVVTSELAILQVYQVATEPPQLMMPSWDDENGFSATLSGESRTLYRIQWSDDLEQWNELIELITEAEIQPVLDETMVEAFRYYRVVSP